jgi:probable F420-dependent oxidoreductase
MARDQRRYWGTVTPLPAPVLSMQAKMQEDAGLEGLFAPQVYGPPFVPLAAAAAVTTRVKLASGIALAFVRSPFETAMAAMDIDRISGGRFVLGLGVSVRSWSEGFFGMPYGKPLEQMREVVEIIRMVNTHCHTGQLKRYEGKYHRHDFRELQPPAPPVRTDIPIWIAALRGPLVSLAAEIGDGVIGHPIWSVDWLTKSVPEPLARGLKRAGKQRSDVEFNAWLFVAINGDKAQAINDARPTVAFYAGIGQYEEYFAAHGFREEARQLQHAVQSGDYLGAAHLVPERMAETFVVCGAPDEVRKKIEPAWDVADSLTLVPPAYGLRTDKLMSYVGAIASTFLRLARRIRCYDGSDGAAFSRARVARSTGRTRASRTCDQRRRRRRLHRRRWHDLRARASEGRLAQPRAGPRLRPRLGGLRTGRLSANALLPLAHSRGADQYSRECGYDRSLARGTMNARELASLKELKSCADGERVTFRARVLRLWEIGGLRMCLVGDESALTRIELGGAQVEEGKSYEFGNAVVREYPGGWHSAALTETSDAIALDDDIGVSEDEAYIERTFKILSGVQRKKGRVAGRVAPWRHPARPGENEG